LATSYSIHMRKCYRSRV